MAGPLCGGALQVTAALPYRGRGEDANARAEAKRRERALGRRESGWRGREPGRRENGAVSQLPPARWWSVRPAGNRKPATYRCPICGHHLPALSEHMLIAPEGDKARRRHAHSACVIEARKRGELPLEEEWRRAQCDLGESGTWLSGALRSLRGLLKS